MSGNNSRVIAIRINSRANELSCPTVHRTLVVSFAGLVADLLTEVLHCHRVSDNLVREPR